MRLSFALPTMTTMPDPIATSADYADALLVARRAKHWLFLLLMLMLLIQIALFFVARYTNLIVPPSATTQPSPVFGKLQYLTALASFLGTVLPVLLSFVLLLIVNIMLVGRLIGVARVTSAYVWCLLLILMLFPWQAYFGGTTDPRDFRVPGVIYSWDELLLYAKFPTADVKLAILKWARFVIFPILTLIVLLLVQGKSNRGLRQAMGQAEPDLKI